MKYFPLIALVLLSVVGVSQIDVWPGVSIQAAVNAASAGDTIIVYAGTYPERVTIAKTVTLQGVGDVKMLGFTINANGVKVSHFNVSATANETIRGAGIYVNADNCQLTDNIIHDTARAGIFMTHTADTV